MGAVCHFAIDKRVKFFEDEFDGRPQEKGLVCNNQWLVIQHPDNENIYGEMDRLIEEYRWGEVKE